jgi:hypothetical protein
VDNTMFKEKSIYYRNIMVRSNYYNNLWYTIYDI